jgi:hypothetical protein
MSSVVSSQRNGPEGSVSRVSVQPCSKFYWCGVRMPGLSHLLSDSAGRRSTMVVAAIDLACLRSGKPGPSGAPARRDWEPWPDQISPVVP